MVVNLYVVCYGYDYEGDVVLGVYDSSEKAEEAATNNKLGDSWSIYTHELNVTNEDPLWVWKQGRVIRDN